MTRKVVIIPDVHAPWGDQGAIDKIIKFISDERPDDVVQLGDLYDFYNFSRYSKSYKVMGPMEEILAGREFAEAMWEAVRLAAPWANRYQLIGNHDIRMRKQLGDMAPAFVAILDYLELDSMWKFKGVDTIFSRREFLEIDGVSYHHGDFDGVKTSRPGARLAYLGKSLVFGHTHAAHVFFANYYGETRFEMSCGHVAMNSAAPLQYGVIQPPNIISAFGCVDSHGPRVIML